MNAIAIVGMACVYPDARSPGELWENALAQRRAFRRVPPERLRLEDYFSADPHSSDTTYATQAAVIEGYEFDRVAFRIVGSTFRAADLAHWLALDIASRALADAGFADGNNLPREATGVLLGNTLTGEFSRANALRLRWPYVRRTVEAALAKENFSAEQKEKFLADLEEKYKLPFPPVGEETLAGGLSNTIAGRICNQFNLKGGGYTVDGACASSLLAVANACSALAANDLDVALAGGVDLSLDPFELVGFAKTGALAPDEMRVFDKNSAGFLPGEGCGMVVLMRHDDAVAQGRRVYAVIRGWGISSDGSGGITRPESDGQLEALRRAYRRAGFGIETVSYCEGHGTGTAVGDATELEVLSRARRETKINFPPAAIGSIKANIGHTKAAAGVAGLIKATMAVHTQVLPPTTGCEQPHAQFGGPSPALRVLREVELWPSDRPLRASVSAMGFGGINAHVVLESVVGERREKLGAREGSLSRSSQDAELFLFAAKSPEELAGQIEKMISFAAKISRAEMADLAAQLEKNLSIGTPSIRSAQNENKSETSRADARRSARTENFRAAIVASKPSELAKKLKKLESWLLDGVASRTDFSENIFLGSASAAPRIAFLFPGQGSPTHLDGGVWRRRFEFVREIYSRAELPADGDSISTRVMQPAVVTASLAGLKVLADFGVTADATIGHSLGEITALHWAGAFDAETLLRLARVRGASMAELGSPTGAMLAVAAPWRDVQNLLNGDPLAIVGFNSPRQTVIAGEADAIKNFSRRAVALGLHASVLPVSHAFHTPLVAAAVPVLHQQLAREKFSELKRKVFSTVTGARLDANENLRELLCRQITSPVRFSSAFEKMRGAADLFIEVGPGAVLSGLISDEDVAVTSLDAGGNSLRGLLQAVGAAFALGARVKTAALFADRFTRPFNLDWKPKFFANPCELAPVSEKSERRAPARPEIEIVPRLAEPMLGAPIELIRRLVAERTELPASAVRDESRMLSDLHLNSITVGQLVLQAAKQLGLPRIVGLTDFANASVAGIARALEDLKRTGGVAKSDAPRQAPPGVANWVRSFTVELVETKRPARAGARTVPVRSTIKNSRAFGAVESRGEFVAAANRDGSRSEAGWQIFAAKNHPLAGPLRVAFGKTNTGGVMVCLPENPGAKNISQLLEAARAVLAMKESPRFVVVQHGWGGGGFARTLHLENPSVATCVMNVPASHPQAVEWIVAEALAVNGFVEVHFTNDGRRFEPRLMLMQQGAMESSSSSKTKKLRTRMKDEDENDFQIGSKDVLLVTGGGKGIAAECALAFARETGVKLALIGRSDPKSDKELADNFARIAAAGVRSGYVRADVTDARAVRAAVAKIESQLGAVTAILHGAGVNTPQLIGALDEEMFQKTVAPKISGAKNILAAVDAKKLKLFVAFGSIIARTGLPGEADYATANEWLAALTNDFQKKHPRCRCLALEWSVWSGAGMGERLGRIETLAQNGITPITVDEGVRMFCELLRGSGTRVPPVRTETHGRDARATNATSLVVTGRFGEPPTLKMLEPELPLRRFLERKRVFYPGVELVVDAELSLQTDPYLADHVVQKQPLLPAVIGLEAMAQAAMALAGSADAPVFENVEFPRPIAVPEKNNLTVRIAALRRENGSVEVCLRSEETDFQVDHFRAVCRFAEGENLSSILHLSPALGHATDKTNGTHAVASVPLEPQADLYGRILFHRGRFCRLRGYRLLKAKECVAEITADDGAAWFGPYLPAEFALGNPAARDAALHAIQACIPHRRILPTGIARVTILRNETGARFVRAKERSRDGNNFIFDVEITGARGEVIERWGGLRLRAVEVLATREAWPAALLAPYLERRLEELADAGAPVKVALERGLREERPTGSDAVIQQALGKAARIWRRPDGKPVCDGGETISAAHALDFTLAVASAGGAACDLEEVAARTDAVWRDLLGGEKFQLAARMTREHAENLDAAATRLWTAVECLKKIGQPATAPLVLESRTDDGWTLLRSGAISIFTCVAMVAGNQLPLAVAVALEARGEIQPARAHVSAVAPIRI
jgi:enediyne polyketide synthase